MTSNIPPQLEERNESQIAEAAIFNAFIERAALHERFKTAIAIDSLRLWRPVERRIVAATRDFGLRSRGNAALETRAFQRYEEIHRRAIDDIVKRIERMVERDLVRFAITESTWTTQTVGEILPGVQLGVMPREIAEKVVKVHPFNGSPLSDWFDSISVDTQRKFVRAAREGIVQGGTADEMARRLSSRAQGNTAFTATQRDIETVAQTAVQHVNSEIRRETFDQMRSSIDAEVWVSTLDSNTCVVCASLDGTEFPDGKGEQPPIHPRCRCVRVPKIKGFTPSERAASGGPVGGDIKFPDWLRGQDEATQNRVLGKMRADLFRANKLNDLDPRLLIDANNRPVRLDELEKRIKR